MECYFCSATVFMKQNKTSKFKKLNFVPVPRCHLRFSIELLRKLIGVESFSQFLNVSIIFCKLQTGVSYIMKIRLGGKGYAPDPNHPLLQFVKGFGEFVDLMQRLQNIIEEETNTR